MNTFAVAPYEEMGPTLLSQQPVTFEKDPTNTDGDWNSIYVHLEARYGMMRTWRFSWWAYWASLAEFLLPRRYHWLVVANRMNRGSQINQQIVDSTATLALSPGILTIFLIVINPSNTSGTSDSNNLSRKTGDVLDNII